MVSETFESFTFVVEREEPTDGILENYVLTFYSDGSYSQVLVGYPFIETDNGNEYNIANINIQIILDENLMAREECDYSWQEIIEFEEGECIFFNCTAGGNHAYGQPCNAEPGSGQEAFVVCGEGGYAVVGCSPSGSSGGPSSGGGSTGGSSSGNSNIIVVLPLEIPIITSILNCINSHTLGQTDYSTIDPALLVNQNISFGSVYNYLIKQNGCSEEAQELVILAIENQSNIDDLVYVIENEQDYRFRMSDEELSLFDTLTFNEQTLYLASAKQAEDKTNELWSTLCEKYNGKGDAFRHSYWNALSSQRIGVALTNQLTTLHENRPPS